MKKQLLLLAVLLSCICSYAQNYECLKFGPKYYYTNSDAYLRGIRIDSVDTVGTNIIYHPYKSARKKCIDCSVAPEIRVLDTFSGSWLGGNVIQENDGTFLFDNLWNDTVIIKTQATLGETWTMFDYSFPLKYTATITRLDTQTVLGVLDSIKVIQIHAYLNDVPYLIDAVEGLEFYLSKNHGFTRAIDLFTFPYRFPQYDSLTFYGPYYIVDHFADRVSHYSGMPDVRPVGDRPAQGTLLFDMIPLKNTRWSSIFNYNVGDEFGFAYSMDEFRTRNCRAVISSISYPEPFAKQYHCTVHITERTVTPVFGSSPIVTYSSFVLGDDIYADTTYVVDLKYMPEEAGHDEYYYYYPSTDSADFCDGSEYDVYEEEFVYPRFSDGRRLIGYGYSIMANHMRYKPKLGRIEGYNYYMDTDDDRYYTSGHFFISSDTCGFYTGIENINEQPKSIVYPNPAKQFINIECHKGMNTVYLTDVTGHVLISSQFTKGKNELNIGQLPDGMYLLKINNEPAVKIIKQE